MSTLKFPDIDPKERLTMPKKIKDKWLKALRSGEYGQCKGKLTDGKGHFCCLGVLQHTVTGGSCETDRFGTDEFAEVPTGSWYTSVGMPGFAGSLTEMNLMDMNDAYRTDNKGRSRGASFKTIAGYIERNIEGV